MPPQTPVRAYCQRLQLVALALIIAQLLLLIFAFSLRVNSVLPDTEQTQLMIKIVFVAGIAVIALSFHVVRRPATDLDQYRKWFFAAFVFAEIGTLIGLALFFLFGTTMPLVVLAVAAAASIYAHYTSITRRILTSRALNPNG